jgi:hypothetical protein
MGECGVRPLRAFLLLVPPPENSLSQPLMPQRLERAGHYCRKRKPRRGDQRGFSSAVGGLGGAKRAEPAYSTAIQMVRSLDQRPRWSVLSTSFALDCISRLS